jgi:hypothetical protein
MRFVRGVAGVMFGAGLLALLGAVNMLQSAPSDLAFGHTTAARGSEWVGGSVQGSSRRGVSSLFFTSRRTWHPNDPRSRGRHHNSED